jgi:hypothetical protein
MMPTHYPVPISVALMIRRMKANGQTGPWVVSASPDLRPLLATKLAASVLRKMRSRVAVEYDDRGYTTTDGHRIPLMAPGTTAALTA